MGIDGKLTIFQNFGIISTENRNFLNKEYFEDIFGINNGDYGYLTSPIYPTHSQLTFNCLSCTAMPFSKKKEKHLN